MMRKPTHDEIVKMREETGLGLAEVKRKLTIKYLRDAISDLAFTSVEQREVLFTLVDLVENKHPADRD